MLVVVIGLLLVDNYWDKSQLEVAYILFRVVISVLGGS
jgi:hypothetical protein